MKSFNLNLLVIAFGFLVISLNSNAQNVGINSTGAAPDASASLDVVAADKGVLVPRISIPNALAAGPVTSPATSLLVYNTNASITNGSGTGFYYWTGTRWEKLSTGSGGSAWELTGNAGTTAGTNFIGTTDAVDWVIKTNNTERGRVYSTGELVFKGTFGTGGTLNLGAGTRMQWSAKKGSLIAGRVTGTQWNDANIGNYNIVGGYNNLTSGDYNIIGGYLNESPGDYNLIAGEENEPHASTGTDESNNMVNGLRNDYSAYCIINGFNNATTQSSATINGNGNSATGGTPTIFGGQNTISGDYGVALGTNHSITGNYGIAVGGSLMTGHTLTGHYGFAMGDNNNLSSSGSHNFASGLSNTISGTTTHAVVFGQSNTVSANGWSITNGFFNTNTAAFSAAFGVQLNLSGTAAFSAGQQNIISGNYSAAIGVSNNISGLGSHALGYFNTISGNNSVSLMGKSGAPNTTSGAEALTIGININNTTGSTFLLGSGVNSTNRLTVSNTYTFGVGFQHTSPTLEVYCPTASAYGRVGIARTPTTNRLEVNGNASKSAAGSWLANSDGRLKKDRKDLDSKTVLDKITQLQGVTYYWDDNQTTFAGYRPTEIQYGFIAQEFQEILPDFVSTDNEGFLQMAYGTLDPLFVEAFKEQQSQIEDLKSEIEELKKLVKADK